MEKVSQIWKQSSQGAHAFSLQRKFENLIQFAKAWCLDYKRKFKIDWQEINKELSQTQEDISSQEDASSDIKAREAALVK